MSKKLNITKNYTVDKTFEKSFELLDIIVSAPFKNSRFSTFGNIASTDPPTFILMAKWISFLRPMFAEIASTKIQVQLFKNNIKTKIIITTKTNPAIIILCCLFLAAFIIKLLTYKNEGDIKICFVYLLLTGLMLIFDRFIKNILIASFEKDLRTALE